MAMKARVETETAPVLTTIPTVFVHVRNLERAKAWYVRVLGLTFDVDHRTADVGGTYLGLFEHERVHPDSHATFLFWTPDLQQAHGALKRRGVPVTEITACGDFNFTDPDGNVMTISSPRPRRGARA